MSSSQLTRIPSQNKIPLATGREGFLCSHNVRMIPKLMWMIPEKMWIVWGRMRERNPDPIAVRHIPPKSHIRVPGRNRERHLSQFPLHPARENLQQDNPHRSPIPAGTPERPCLTPNTLGCAFRKPCVWNEVLAGAWEPEASWAARGSVAGITSVMILTLPASVTVVVAMAWEQAQEAEGIPRCFPPPLPPLHRLFAVRNPREVVARQGHTPAALCSLREARSWNSRQAPLAQ